MWEVTIEHDILKLDVGALNVLDRENEFRRLERLIETNVFRHKFIRVNREWVIQSLA